MDAPTEILHHISLERRSGSDGASSAGRGIRDGFAAMITGRTAGREYLRDSEGRVQKDQAGNPTAGVGDTWKRFLSDPNSTKR